MYLVYVRTKFKNFPIFLSFHFDDLLLLPKSNILGGKYQKLKF